MSQSPPAAPGPLPVKIIEEREVLVSNLKKVLHDDVKLMTADGEVWANKALLSASSDYFSAMLDEEKFKEGREGVGDLTQYSKEVVNKVVNYFYGGEISCQDWSLSSLLHLEELLRKILLLPQSAEIKKFTVEEMSLKKFPISECLLGLVTAEDLKLDTATEIFTFITDNLGILCLKKSLADLGSRLMSNSPSVIERFESVINHLNDQDEETKKRILSSLDLSAFSQKELSDIIRKAGPKPVRPKRSTHIYKDIIFIGCDKGEVFFFPQHYNKLE